MTASRLASHVLLPLLFAGCVTSLDDGPTTDDPQGSDPFTPQPQPDPADPDPDPETPAQAVDRLLAQWQSCMRIEDFQTARMSPSWAEVRTENNSRCVSCHVNGSDGFIATSLEQQFFDVLKTRREYLLQYVTVDLLASPLAMIVNRESFRGVARGQAPHAEHPRFDADGNAGMMALETWYDLVQTRIAIECAPSPQ